MDDELEQEQIFEAAVKLVVVGSRWLSGKLDPEWSVKVNTLHDDLVRLCSQHEVKRMRSELLKITSAGNWITETDIARICDKEPIA